MMNPYNPIKMLTWGGIPVKEGLPLVTSHEFLAADSYMILLDIFKNQIEGQKYYLVEISIKQS